MVHFKVSVIVAAYNAEGSIEKSIKTLQEQSLKQIEIIIVNDASTDNTAAIVESLMSEDPRIRLISLSENQGVYKARAKGLTMAQADWIGFLDADDYAKPSMYMQLFGCAVKNEVDLVICQSDRVNVNRKKLSAKVRFSKNELVEDKIFERFCHFQFGTGALWNKLYRAELLKKWALIEHSWRQDTNEDVLINLGVFQSAEKIYLLKKTLHEYTFNPKSVTSSKTRLDAIQLLLRAFFLALFLSRKHGFTVEERMLISHLYRIQLDFFDYRLEGSDEFLKLDDDFLRVYREVSQVFPMEVVALISRLPVSEKKTLIDKFIRFCKQKLYR